MKAVVCVQYCEPEALQLQDLSERGLESGEVRITIKAAGINFADYLKIGGKYQEKPALPWIPGTELSGVISEIGSGVTDLHIGQRVMGVSDIRGGGFAESMVLPSERVLPLPDAVTFEQAAALPVVYGTAMYALVEKAGLKAGSYLLVMGAAGGAGLAAVEIASVMGAHVIAVASSEAKRRLALKAGATHAIDYTLPDWSRHLRNVVPSSRVDVVFDPVGGAAFSEAEKCIGWEGKYLLVGFASGEIPSVALNKPLVKGYDLLGVRYDVWRDRNWSKARRSLQQVLAYVADGAIKPQVSATLPLHQTGLAIRQVSERGGLGKLVIRIDESC
ncbi:NADPH:quinone oxidoreductase family protein [Alicycliphilus sp. T452]|jgi:NADPH2:quinone reductase